MKNCRTGKGDEALSFWFLMLWILGDSANLIGALLTKQLATEVSSAFIQEWRFMGVQSHVVSQGECYVQIWLDKPQSKPLYDVLE